MKMILTHCLVLLGFHLMSLLHGSVAHRDLDWWESTVMYQTYQRSFKDSNGDGVGDFNGIYEKLDYLKDIGIETVWIQPFHNSPNADMGYDISDYRSIDPLFGTTEDFKKLVKGIHDRGLKVIMDYVPNHTSDEHEWFRLSENRVEPYTDYYVWRDPKRVNDTYTTYPNNWISVFEPSAWTWSEKRKQYYYHAFATKQPDLNLRNPRVRQETVEVLKYWMDLKMDGFRVDAVQWLIEADHFMDEPEAHNEDGPPKNPFYTLEHIYTKSQPENLELIREWRQALDEYKRKDGQTRLLTVEAFEYPKILVKYMGNSTHPIVHFPLYLRLNYIDRQANASVLHKLIWTFIENLPEGKLPNWVLDSHDVRRISTRMSPDSVDSYNMLVLLLPGTTCVFYGSEIGLEDVIIREDQRKDPAVDADNYEPRDYCRTPMPWDDTKNAGFTTNEMPWLPVQPNYWRVNVKRQQEDSNSHLKVFKRLVALKKTPVIKYGQVDSYVLSEWVYMFTRIHNK